MPLLTDPDSTLSSLELGTTFPAELHEPAENSGEVLEEEFLVGRVLVHPDLELGVLFAGPKPINRWDQMARRVKWERAVS